MKRLDTPLQYKTKGIFVSFYKEKNEINKIIYKMKNSIHYMKIFYKAKSFEIRNFSITKS
jgi:hypothetical protein